MFQELITQAVILSGGLGLRLRPLTREIPKVMIPIAGKPLLERHILQFKKYGIAEFFINLHYLPEKIKDYFGDGSEWGVKIVYVYEPKILGTAGGVKNFESQLENNFFVIYGDIFSLVDYSQMTKAFFKKSEAIGMELVGDTDHPKDSDLVTIDSQLRFLKIYPKPHKKLPSNYKSMRAVYIFNKRILSYIPLNQYYELDHDLLPDILAKGEEFYGYETKDYLQDIGTSQRYQAVNDYLKTL